jgi:hypothetical protein
MGVFASIIIKRVAIAAAVFPPLFLRFMKKL